MPFWAFYFYRGWVFFCLYCAWDCVYIHPVSQKKDRKMDDIQKLERQLSALKSDRKNLNRNGARIRALEARLNAANTINQAKADSKTHRR